MAFVVEDGTGLSTANAYISVGYADAYFLDRNNTSWVGTTAAKQGAIVQATDFIEKRWGSRFLGRPEFLNTPQSLSFPRLNLTDRYGRIVSGLPDKLKQATAEYALRALSGSLLPDPTVDASGFAIQSKTEKIGPIEETTVFQTAASSPVLLKPYPTADRLLSDFVTTSGKNYR